MRLRSTLFCEASARSFSSAAFSLMAAPVASGLPVLIDGGMTASISAARLS
jgi:hypothetical protein